VSKYKDNSVKIVQMVPNMGHGGFSSVDKTLGLGSDSKLYIWDYEKGKWVKGWDYEDE
jgi:hypothetical protein